MPKMCYSRGSAGATWEEAHGSEHGTTENRRAITSVCDEKSQAIAQLRNW